MLRVRARSMTIKLPPDADKAPAGPYRVWVKYPRGKRVAVGEPYAVLAEAVSVAHDQLTEIGVYVYIRCAAGTDVGSWRVVRQQSGGYSRR